MIFDTTCKRSEDECMAEIFQCYFSDGSLYDGMCMEDATINFSSCSFPWVSLAYILYTLPGV